MHYTRWKKKCYRYTASTENNLECITKTPNLDGLIVAARYDLVFSERKATYGRLVINQSSETLF
jgi:hypothetical protein